MLILSKEICLNSTQNTSNGGKSPREARNQGCYVEPVAFSIRLIGSRGEEPCGISVCVRNPATDRLCDPKVIRQILLPVFAESGHVEAGAVASWHGSPSVCARAVFLHCRSWTSVLPEVPSSLCAHGARNNSDVLYVCTGWVNVIWKNSWRP